MSFDKIFDLTAGVYIFLIYNMSFDEILDLTAAVYFIFS